MESTTTPTWVRRHAWIVGLICVLATALIAATLLSRLSNALVLIPAATLIGPALASALPHRDRTLLGTISATALVVQAMYAVALFGGDARPNTLLVTVLCLVALYEIGWLLLLTFGVSLIALYGLTASHPSMLGIDASARAINIEFLTTGVLITVAVVALAVFRRDHVRLQARADRQQRETTAYLAVSGDVLVILDPAGRVTSANRQACELLGRKEDEILGQEWFELALPHEYRREARRLYAESYEAFTSIGELVYQPLDYENEILSSNGSRRSVVWWAVMLADPQGVPTSLVCSGIDVTDSRIAAAELERSRTELDALRRLAQTVASLDDSRQAIVDAAVALTGASMAGIVEPDRTRSRVSFSTCTQRNLLGYTVELGRDRSLLADAFLSGQPRFSPRLDLEPGTASQLARRAGAVSVIHQPIVGPDGTVGVLSVAWDHHVESLQERKAELVGLIAHEAAIALRRRASLAQLERAALIDSLTGVANRRAFDAELPAALRRATDARYPLALVMLDLNDFKAVNDVLGHEAGDDLLVAASSAWASMLRAGDLLARLGGDEFAVLLPDCDEFEMDRIIERLHRATPHHPGASIGGAMWDGSEATAGLIRRADRAQYADKARMKGEAAAPSVHMRQP